MKRVTPVTTRGPGLVKPRFAGFYSPPTYSLLNLTVSKVIYGYLRLFTVIHGLAHSVNRRSRKVATRSVTLLKTAHSTAEYVVEWCVRGQLCCPGTHQAGLGPRTKPPGVLFWQLTKIHWRVSKSHIFK